MDSPRKIRFFGLRKQFNLAVEAIRLLLMGQLRMIDEIQTLQKRVAALEATQEMDAMQEMFDDGWDAAMESMEQGKEFAEELAEELAEEIVEELDAPDQPED